MKTNRLALLGAINQATFVKISADFRQLAVK